MRPPETWLRIVSFSRLMEIEAAPGKSKVILSPMVGEIGINLLAKILLKHVRSVV